MSDETAQPTASVDAEPVAWCYVNFDGECEQIEYGPDNPGDECWTPLYTEAQMQARADRIAALEAKLAEKDALLRAADRNVYRLQQGGGNLCAALRRIQDEGDAHSNAIATAALNHKAADTTLAKIKDATDAD